MRKFVDNFGIFHFLLDSETPLDNWTEVVDTYKRYKAPNGDIHTILADALPEDDWVEEDFDMFAYPDPSFVPPYTALRRNSYPEINEQLDMLWHEINQNGTISTSGTWFQTIQTIKTDFPKDE